MDQTPFSLLERLRQPADELSWQCFVDLYTPLLCHWARHLGAAEQDVADFVQDVFVVLVRKMPEFRYDPQKRFRGWLWTVTLNKWRERCRRPAPVGQAGPEVLEELPVPDSAPGLEAAEYNQYLTLRALEVMRAKFQPATWQAFWQCVALGRPAAEVARELGTTENAIYIGNGRILRRLRKELEGLLD
jgi:RNA polymerase sigma-70 factor (ECF subfamily)